MSRKLDQLIAQHLFDIQTKDIEIIENGVRIHCRNYEPYSSCPEKAFAVIREMEALRYSKWRVYRTENGYDFTFFQEPLYREGKLPESFAGEALGCPTFEEAVARAALDVLDVEVPDES